MAAKSLNNLETVVLVDFSNDVVKVVSETILNFKKDETISRGRELGYKQVLNAYSDVIIAALEARRVACLDMLTRNLDNIIHNDGHQIIFKKNNGSTHSFNTFSYEAMGNAIDMINRGEFGTLQGFHYDQMIKALYWIEKPADRSNISFGNLISCIMELIICGTPAHIIG